MASEPAVDEGHLKTLSTVVPAHPVRPDMKRLNINLPSTLLEELQQLASSSGKSMTEVVRTALGLVHVAYTQTGPNRRLTISDETGKALKEIIVPR